jgi:hypothetical protein
MALVCLSWSDADVKDARLTVPLEVDGDLPSGWKESFENTVRLLGSGDWGEVRLKKHRVLVSDVIPGSEAKLKHHLEAIVAQANASLQEPESPANDDEVAEERGDEGGPEGEQNGPDAEMTERFRSG